MFNPFNYTVRDIQVDKSTMKFQSGFSNKYTKQIFGYFYTWYMQSQFCSHRKDVDWF